MHSTFTALLILLVSVNFKQTAAAGCTTTDLNTIACENAIPSDLIKLANTLKVKVYILNIWNSTFTSIEPSLFNVENLRSIKSLTIARSNVQTIEPKSFNSLPDLLSVTLSNNNITVIKSGTFSNLPHLGYVDLYNSNVQLIETGAFENLTGIASIILSKNNINLIEKGAFRQLPTLLALPIESAAVKTIESGAFEGLGAVYTLLLSDNSITEISAGTFNDLVSLQQLYLDGNLLPSLDAKVLYPLKKLTTLEISGNKLVTLDAQGIVNNLPKLKTVTLYDNSWDCDQLKNIADVFDDNGVTYQNSAHQEFNGTNINGIRCNNSTLINTIVTAVEHL